MFGYKVPALLLKVSSKIGSPKIYYIDIELYYIILYVVLKYTILTQSIWCTCLMLISVCAMRNCVYLHICARISWPGWFGTEFAIYIDNRPLLWSFAALFWYLPTYQRHSHTKLRMFESSQVHLRVHIHATLNLQLATVQPISLKSFSFNITA